MRNLATYVFAVLYSWSLQQNTSVLLLCKLPLSTQRKSTQVVGQLTLSYLAWNNNRRFFKKFQIVITATPADLTVLVGYCLAGIKRESRDLRISPGKHDWPRSYRALERNSRSLHWGQTGNHPKRRQTKTTGVTRDHFVSQAVQRGCWKSKWLSTRNWTEISRRGIAR